MTAADGTKIAEDLQERYDSACAVADSGRNYDYTGLPVALITYKWALSSKELIERISRAEERERVLREALDGMEAPITFSEAEQSVTLPMGMERFIEIVDFANLILARRVVINRKRAALATPAQPQTGGE